MGEETVVIISLSQTNGMWCVGRCVGRWERWWWKCVSVLD